jgi:hypothetical protein
MPLYLPARRPLPNPAAGQYLLTSSPGQATTSNTLGNSTLRLAPWLVETALRIDRIGGDVATVGEAGSKIRLGIYGDNGGLYPGTLLLDAGQIAGDSATVQELTVSLTLAAGLYWIGGAVQSATTTQPTVRIQQNWTPPVATPLGASLPTAGQGAVGFQQTSVTGALPSTFTATVTVSGSAPRVLVRTA